MREILFRGKRIDNGEWIFGNLLDTGRGSSPKDYFILPESGAEFDEYIQVDPATVGQYTGLKGKNGKRIFEGDIIKISEVLRVLDFITDVYFDNSGFRYRHADGSGSILPRHTKKVEGYEDVTSDVEIIGNVVDNPELLEEL